ncbi:MAG: AbrB family transcriptional regulator [Chloroflexi bacterium]|nr:AbrB family transcriptional regulator [Chloroflexota bacterium]
MQQRDMRVIGKCFGTAVVGPRGQLVVPVEARKELGIDAGNKFLVFSHFEGQGLIFIKVEAAEKLLNIVTSRLDEIAKLIRGGETSTVAREDKHKRS